MEDAITATFPNFSQYIDLVNTVSNHGTVAEYRIRMIEALHNKFWFQLTRRDAEIIVDYRLQEMNYTIDEWEKNNDEVSE